MLITLQMGKLILEDTCDGEIQIKNKEDNTIQTIRLNQDMKNLSNKVWQDMMGCDIEAVVVDDEAVNVYDVTAEEE